MNYSTDQVIRGIINYADDEVITKLPTAGKWIVGTVIGVASNKTAQVMESLKKNSVVNMLGILDENDNIDVDSLIIAMKSAADKYGNVTLDVPMVGRLTFTSSDLDRLRSYIV